MKKRYVFLIAMVPVLLCVSSWLWYRSQPVPIPTATPRRPSAVTATVPPAKISTRWPSWSPDGKQIAYIRIEDKLPAIIVYDLETGEQVIIFEDAYEILAPVWSPGGDRIAFTAQIGEGDTFQLYTIQPDGAELQRLTYGEQDWIFPTWSTDGEKIVYRVLNIKDNYSMIFMINPDGTDQELLTKVYNLLNFSISPDRGKMIFTTASGSTINVKDLVSDEDSSLTDEPDAVFQQAIWSPDGNLIAYTTHLRLRGEIHLINPANGTVVELTDMSQEDRMLAWSPDGKTIAFRRTKPPETSIGDIYLIDVDGENIRQLTNTPFDELECTWSPNGDQIAITLSDPMPPFWDVYIINIDGSGMFRLRDNMPYP